MKIWGIGLSRTGSTSLSDALAMLGYSTAHVILPKDFDKYDAVVDSTATVRYKELDARYPGSKFILTVRADIEAWLTSYHRHIGTGELGDWTPEWCAEILYYRPLLFGGIGFDRDVCRAHYFAHVEAVHKHFDGRPKDLLEIDIPGGDGWEKLCAFLDKSIPDEPFPWLNQGDLSRRGFQKHAAKYDLKTGELIRRS